MSKTNALLTFMLFSCAFASERGDNQCHFNTTTDYMKKSNSQFYKFVVDDIIFNNIHKKVNLTNLRKSACFIDAVKISGSATIFDVTNNNQITQAKAITAGHVVYDKAFNKFEKIDDTKILYPTIYQGMVEHKDKIANLAIYETDRICFDKKLPRRDLAILYSKLKETPLNFDELKAFKSDISANKHDKKIIGVINHHPLGVLEQRMNGGDVDPDGCHLIPTMPGSSGGGIHDKNGDLAFVHIQGDTGGDKVLYDLSILKMQRTEDKIFETGFKNYSVPFSKSDLNDFTECFNKQ